MTMFPPPSITDVRRALEPLAPILRPDGDNEGDPINSETVFPYLCPKEQEDVRHAEEVVMEYTRAFGHEINRRALTIMGKNGFPTSLGPSQYNPERLVGTVSVGDWELDISDPHSEGDDEWY